MALMSTLQDRPFIPLSSDTETRPTAAMRVAIANAEVGDEQRGEDPTVNRLQARVAELLGKEAALWFPGGTMCINRRDLTTEEIGLVVDIGDGCCDRPAPTPRAGRTS